MMPISATYRDLQSALEAFESRGIEDRGAKGRRILEAATELFVRHGYRRVSVEDVAREAGVAKGTVYLYFESKAELMLQAMLTERRRYLERFREVLEAEMPARERLETWMRSLIVVGAEMPLVSRLLCGDREMRLLLEELDADLLEQALELRIEFLTGLLEAAAPELEEGELRERARILIALFQAADFFLNEEDRLGMPLERFADRLAHLLVDGFLAREEELAT